MRLGGEVEEVPKSEKGEEKKIQLSAFDEEGKFVGKPFEVRSIAFFVATIADSARDRCQPLQRLPSFPSE